MACLLPTVMSAMKVCPIASLCVTAVVLTLPFSSQMESSVTAPVSGHIKRVVVQEGERAMLLRFLTGG